MLLILCEFYFKIYRIQISLFSYAIIQPIVIAAGTEHKVSMGGGWGMFYDH